MENILVAKLISLGEIVINKGSKDGIKPEMEFIVYRLGEEVFDPVTKKSLGNLEFPKGGFRILHIQENITTLVSKKKIPNHMLFTINLMNEQDKELSLLQTISVGDKVKITNLVDGIREIQ